VKAHQRVGQEAVSGFSAQVSWKEGALREKSVPNGCEGITKEGGDEWGGQEVRKNSLQPESSQEKFTQGRKLTTFQKEQGRLGIVER